MQQQMNDLARRFNMDRAGRWFRVGVMSASAVAPLVARWNELRTSKRPDRHADRHIAGYINVGNVGNADNAGSAGTAEPREQAVSALRQASGRINQASGRLRESTTRLIQQTAPVAGRMTERVTERARAVIPTPSRARRQPSTGLWLAGVAVGLVAAGVTAYIVARRRLSQTAYVYDEEETLVELPLNDNITRYSGSNTSSATGESEPVRNGRAAASAPTPETAPTVTIPVTSSDEIDTPEEAEAARYVGNIHTMVFHDADDTAHLPAEENRIYFATEEEALAAGYHRSHLSEGSAQVGSSETPTA